MFENIALALNVYSVYTLTRGKLTVQFNIKLINKLDVFKFKQLKMVFNKLDSRSFRKWNTASALKIGVKKLNAYLAKLRLAINKGTAWHYRNNKNRSTDHTVLWSTKWATQRPLSFKI